MVMALSRATGGVILRVTKVTLAPELLDSMGSHTVVEEVAVVVLVVLVVLVASCARRCRRRRRRLLLLLLVASLSSLLQDEIWVAPSRDWAVVTLKACRLLSEVEEVLTACSSVLDWEKLYTCTASRVVY